MSINNVQAVSDALKYINGVEIEDKSSSVLQDVKNSIFNPISVGFGGLQVVTGVKDITKASSVKEAFEVLKSGTFAMEEATFENSIKYFQDLAAPKPVTTAVAEAGANTGFFATIKSGLSKAFNLIPGSSCLKSGWEQFGNTGLGKVVKGSGASMVAVLEGVIGLVTEVVPAFMEGGFESGIKQLGKTTLKATGAGLGWAGGSVAGRAVGGAIGTVLGGPAGTAIGCLIGGFIGSVAGSVVGAGVAKKITGKSEVEILRDQKIDEQAQMIAQDKDAMKELNELVIQKVLDDEALGETSKDTEIMVNHLTEGAYSVNQNAPSCNQNLYKQADELHQTLNSNPDFSQQQIKKQAITNANYFEEMAERIAKGDTSMYNISDEKLNSVFHASNPSSSSNSTSVFDQRKKEVVNYYG